MNFYVNECTGLIGEGELTLAGLEATNEGQNAGSHRSARLEVTAQVLGLMSG